MTKIDFDIIADVCEAWGLDAHIDSAAFGFSGRVLGKEVIGTPVNIWNADGNEILWSGIIDTDEDLNEALSYYE